MLGGIYLNEYGGTRPLARLIRFLSEVMTGVPVDRDGPLHLHVGRAATPRSRPAFAGALALGVPHAADRDPHHRPDAVAGARASSARAATRSGAARSRTIRTVVLPNAAPGIVSGALLAVARAAGETAPLLFTIGIVDRDQHATCSRARTPRCRCRSSATPSRRSRRPQDRAWGAALTLIVIVFVFTHPGPARDRLLRPPAGGMTPEDGSMPTLVDLTTNVIDVTTDVDAPPPTSRLPTRRRPRRSPSASGSWSSSCRTSRCNYSGHTAVREVDLDIAAQRDHRVHRAVGLRQDHRAAVPQPHARPHARRARCSAGSTYHGENLYGPKVDAAEVRRRIGMVFQKPNPFPKTIFDNVAYGPKLNGTKRSRARRHRRARADARRAVGRGEGQAQAQRRSSLSGGQQQRLCIARAHRGRARRRAHGRTVLGARPDRDRAHRGPDGGAQARVHHRDRHAQHAAGRARRPTAPRSSPPRSTTRAGESAVSSSTTSPRRSSPHPPTPAPRATSPGGSVEAHEPTATRRRTPSWNRRSPERSGRPRAASRCSATAVLAALDELRQGVFVLDADGVEVFRNPAAERYREARHSDAVVAGATRRAGRRAR